LKRAIFATVFTVAFLLSILVVFYPTFGGSAELYPAALLVILPTFLFTFAPWFRLARLGEYLRQGGIDNMATRGSFQTRDDHFFLDYSIGRWFQHALFALGYLGLMALYFVGWFLISVFLFLFSIPVLAIFFLVSRWFARRLLSPYDPKDVASRIELIYPAKSLRAIAANPPLLTIGFFYLVVIGYLAPTPFVILLSAIPYATLLLYVRVIRPRFRPSRRQ
jgi:hypothetical protein